ncbi:MAG: choice-of-anchor L domain-containing protein [Bacteroidia bacterium]|nr:choice-of-anchor L domain-containing protein [Bacteroidia bacterium]
MKLKIIILSSFMIIGLGSFAQVFTVDTTNLSIEQLVKDVLVTGCVNVSNIHYTGSRQAIGDFDASQSSLPFFQGVIMSTGQATHAAGPNNDAGGGPTAAGGQFGLPGDSLLNTIIAPQTTEDACVLEFDFVPSLPNLAFQYIFGSEEYPEYVGQINDVFGFFISGPNPSGGNYANYNIALIPTTNIPVSINNLNSTNYPAYYIDNGDGSAPNNEILQYDGYTTALTASVTVTPCSTYHIKLAIADAQDDAWDSGVLIKSNSFAQAAIPKLHNYAVNQTIPDSIIYEGCTDYVVFTRPDSTTLPTAYTINLLIGGTAVNGVDYSQFPTTVVIPAGHYTDTVYYSAFMNNVADVNKYIIFSLNGACACNYSPINDTIWILDNWTLDAGIVENDTTYCSSDQVFINLHTFVPPQMDVNFYTFTWNSGSHNTSLYVNPASGATTTYYVTITDKCGQVVTDHVSITVSNISGLNITTTDNLCFGGHHGSVNVTPVGGFSPYTYTWTPANAGPSTTGYTNSLAFGNYTVTVTDHVGCFKFINFMIDQPDSLFFSYGSTDVTCFDGIDGSATIQGFGGTTPYTYHWSTGSTATTITDIHGGYYLVTITDANLCKTTTSIYVHEPDSLIIHTSPDVYMCLHQNAAVSVTATGGTSAYSFDWNNGQSGPSMTVSPALTTTYYVTCTDINGCISAPDSVTVHIYPPINAHLTTLRDSICKGESTELLAAISGGTGGPYNCFLNDGASTTIIAPPFYISPTHTTTYEIIVQDFCGSPEGTASITIFVFNPPDVFFTSDITEGCKPLSVSFQDLSSLTGSTYKWNFGDGSNTLLSTTENPTHVFMNEGVYDITLMLTNSVGCTNSYTIPQMITVHSNPVARFIPDPSSSSILNPIIFFDNYSDDSFINTWSFGDNSQVSNSVSPEHSYPAIGTYIVRLITENAYHCLDTAYSQVTIHDSYSYYAPNAFNPNSTILQNRTFMPIGYGFDPDNFHFIIYDRWGGKVYETFDVNHPWDGIINGKTVEAGSVYPWIVIYKDLNGVEHRDTGTVTIIN